MTMTGDEAHISTCRSRCRSAVCDVDWLWLSSPRAAAEWHFSDARHRCQRPYVRPSVRPSCRHATRPSSSTALFVAVLVGATQRSLSRWSQSIPPRRDGDDRRRAAVHTLWSAGVSGRLSRRIMRSVQNIVVISRERNYCEIRTTVAGSLKVQVHPSVYDDIDGNVMSFFTSPWNAYVYTVLCTLSCRDSSIYGSYFN